MSTGQWLRPAGDWFNRLDWSCNSNNFGVGLPPAAKNEAAWPIKAPLLADPAMKPSPELIKVTPLLLLLPLCCMRATCPMQPYRSRV